MQTHESSVPSLCSELFAVSVFKVLGMRPPMKRFTEREQILQLSSELMYLL
jgi:hypothetical protein